MANMANLVIDLYELNGKRYAGITEIQHNGAIVR